MFVIEADAGVLWHEDEKEHAVRSCVYRKMVVRICFLALLSGVFSVATADTVVLKGGQQLIGDILAEKEHLLYVDIGVDVVTVPKDKILEYRYSAQEGQSPAEPADVNESNIVTVEVGPESGRLYRTASLAKTSIEKCVERFGESVVKVSSPAGMGSGFFINADGYLITNYHVIEKETKIEVTVFREGQDGFEPTKFKTVKIEAINPFVDLALLKVEDAEAQPFKFAYLGSMADLMVGEDVFAIGNPLGLERTVTDGVISTKNRAFEGLVYVQTNADINPGNSGGPLFDLAGQVIGVTNMGYIFFGGLGFAIPVDYLKHFIENREAFVYDKDNPNTGFKYIQPDRRRNMNRPVFLEDTGKQK
jgi:serine protease Do